MTNENETLEEKHNRLTIAIGEYTILVDKLCSNVKNTSKEDLEKVLKELKVMRDEALQAESDIKILTKLMGG
jgi:hypothetical protein